MDSLEAVLGPLLIGTTVAAVLYGIMFLQCFIYYMHCKNDRWILKLVILSVFLADTAGVVLSTMAAYNYLVQSFANELALIFANTGIIAYPAITALNAFLVRCVYAWRIQVIAGKTWIAYSIWLVSFFVFLAGIGVSVGIWWVSELPLLYKIRTISLVWSFGSLSIDSFITTVLFWYLPRLRTGFPAIDDVLTRILRVSVQTGFFTAITVTATTIMYLVDSGSTVYLGLLFVTSKLYGNSLLATFTMRDSWGMTDRKVSRYPVLLPPRTSTMQSTQSMQMDYKEEMAMDSISSDGRGRGMMPYHMWLEDPDVVHVAVDVEVEHSEHQNGIAL